MDPLILSLALSTTLHYAALSLNQRQPFTLPVSQQFKSIERFDEQIDRYSETIANRVSFPLYQSTRGDVTLYFLISRDWTNVGRSRNKPSIRSENLLQLQWHF